MYIALGVCIGYLCGSIPFSYLIVRYLKGTDIRTFGDGNVGATNVRRIAGRKAGALAFFCDVAKGVFPVLFGEWVLGLPPYGMALSGLAAIIGHNWPLFLNFKGGKGVSTTMGVLGSLAPWEGLITLIPFLSVYLLFLHHDILSLLIVAPLLPFLAFAFGRSLSFIACLCLILGFVYIRGIPNIRQAWREVKDLKIKK